MRSLEGLREIGQNQSVLERNRVGRRRDVLHSDAFPRVAEEVRGITLTA